MSNDVNAASGVSRRPRNDDKVFLTAIANNTVVDETTGEKVLDIKGAAEELGIAPQSVQTRCSTLRQLGLDLPKGESGKRAKTEAEKLADATAIWESLNN